MYQRHFQNGHSANLKNRFTQFTCLHDNDGEWIFVWIFMSLILLLVLNFFLWQLIFAGICFQYKIYVQTEYWFNGANFCWIDVAIHNSSVNNEMHCQNLLKCAIYAWVSTHWIAVVFVWEIYRYQVIVCRRITFFFYTIRKLNDWINKWTIGWIVCVYEFPLSFYWWHL